MKLKTDSVLTKAETRIAVGYTEGKIGKEIANDYNLSYNTVVRHTQNIYDKAGIPRSTNSLVAWFISKNFDIDLKELRRGLGSVLLLCVLSFQSIFNYADSKFVRQQPVKKSEATRQNVKRLRKQEDSTLDLYSYEYF